MIALGIWALLLAALVGTFVVLLLALRLCTFQGIFTGVLAVGLLVVGVSTVGWFLLGPILLLQGVL